MVVAAVGWERSKVPAVGAERRPADKGSLGEGWWGTEDAGWFGKVQGAGAGELGVALVQGDARSSCIGGEGADNLQLPDAGWIMAGAGAAQVLWVLQQPDGQVRVQGAARGDGEEHEGVTVVGLALLVT